jgi:hypothetical protein
MGAVCTGCALFGLLVVAGCGFAQGAGLRRVSAHSVRKTVPWESGLQIRLGNPPAEAHSRVESLSMRAMLTFCRTLLPVLLLLRLPTVAQARFDFTTNNGTIIITAYTSSVGAVGIPKTTNG